MGQNASSVRTAVTSVGPVLEEIEGGLGVSSAAAGVLTTMPVVCFAAIGFAGPPLAARFRDAHVLAGALLTMAAGLVLRAQLFGAPEPLFLQTTLDLTGRPSPGDSEVAHEPLELRLVGRRHADEEGRQRRDEADEERDARPVDHA